MAGYCGNLRAEHGGAMEGKNVHDLAEENAPNYFNDDDQIRDWVSNHTGAEIRGLSTDAKIQMINVLLSGWVAGEDISAIRSICRSVSERSEAAAIRHTIESELIHLQSIGQRTELRVVLTQMP
jgi:hypothetical protein